MNGADLLCGELSALGVECVFGLPGTQNIPLYEALRRTRIRSVVPTHELAGGFMANGYYRASGKVAALLTIPGPGFMYALPGIAEARHDSAAILHIVGSPASGTRKFQFQAVDQRHIAQELAKGTFLVNDAADVPAVTAEAYLVATTGEPGPVLLEYSDRVLEGAAGGAKGRIGPHPGVAAAIDDRAVERAAALLSCSRHPLIFAGQGCADAHVELRELAELIPAPVFTTLSGRGVLPEDHELALGFEFTRGDIRALNELIAQSDCVLAVGCKLTAAGTDCFRLELPAHKLIHVDASADTLRATYVEQLSLAAPAEAFLARAVESIRSRRAPGTGWTRSEVRVWRERLRAPVPLAEPAFEHVAPRTAAAFLAGLQRALPRDAIVVTDCGFHQTLVRRYLEVRSPRGLIAPSDFQSMGFGLPAAIGAKLAAPHRAVLAMIGDGGFAMTAMELLTAVRQRLTLTVVVFNDGYLGRVRLQQSSRYGHTEGCDLVNPDFEALAKAIGVAYARVDGDIESTVRAAVERVGPTLIEVTLRDSPAIHVERVKGQARGVLRRVVPPETLRWLKRQRAGR